MRRMMPPGRVSPCPRFPNTRGGRQRPRVGGSRDGGLALTEGDQDGIRAVSPGLPGRVVSGTTRWRPVLAASAGRVPRVSWMVRRGAIAEDRQRDRLVGREREQQQVQRMVGVDRRAIDGGDDVLGLEAGVGSGMPSSTSAPPCPPAPTSAWIQAPLVTRASGPRRAGHRCPGRPRPSRGGDRLPGADLLRRWAWRCRWGARSRCPARCPPSRCRCR